MGFWSTLEYCGSGIKNVAVSIGKGIGTTAADAYNASTETAKGFYYAATDKEARATFVSEAGKNYVAEGVAIKNAAVAVADYTTDVAKGTYYIGNDIGLQVTAKIVSPFSSEAAAKIKNSGGGALSFAYHDYTTDWATKQKKAFRDVADVGSMAGPIVYAYVPALAPVGYAITATSTTVLETAAFGCALIERAQGKEVDLRVEGVESGVGIAFGFVPGPKVVKIAEGAEKAVVRTIEKAALNKAEEAAAKSAAKASLVPMMAEAGREGTWFLGTVEAKAAYAAERKTLTTAAKELSEALVGHGIPYSTEQASKMLGRKTLRAAIFDWQTPKYLALPFAGQAINFGFAAYDDAQKPANTDKEFFDYIRTIPVNGKSFDELTSREKEIVVRQIYAEVIAANHIIVDNKDPTKRLSVDDLVKQAVGLTHVNTPPYAVSPTELEKNGQQEIRK